MQVSTSKRRVLTIGHNFKSSMCYNAIHKDRNLLRSVCINLGMIGYLKNQPRLYFYHNVKTKRTNNERKQFMYKKKILIIIVLLTVGLIFSDTVFSKLNMINASEETIYLNNIEESENRYKEGTVSVLSQEVQEKEDNALKKYNKLIRFWSEDSVNADGTCVNYPEFYGGAYLDEDKNLVVQIANKEETFKEYFENLVGVDGIKFRQVNNPYTKLLSIQKTIDSAIASGKYKCGQFVSLTAIDDRNNEVVLMIDSVKHNKPVSSMLLEILESTDRNIVKLLDTNDKFSVTSSLYPGDEIDNSYNTFRSAGFWAYNTSGELGIVTSPHNSLSYGETIYKNGMTFGTAGIPYYTGGDVDAVFVKRTSNSFQATRYVNGWGFYLAQYTTYDTIPGSTVYIRGCATGCQCGTVLYSTSTIHDYDIGSTVYNCSVVDTDRGVAHGDSGGIVAAGGNSNTRYITGIMFSGNTNTGGTMMGYCKIGHIRSTLGITQY